MLVELQHCEKNYKFLLNSKRRINILYGSAGSGKSWSVAQFLLFERMLAGKKLRILVARKTYPSLKKSCWLLFNDLIEQYNLENVCDVRFNRSELSIAINDSEMFFVSLDDVQKLKSFERINYVWVEEAMEISKDEFLQLNLRCRGVNRLGNNQLYFTFNPVDENSFWRELCNNPPPNVAVCQSTYIDNPFLPDEYIEQIERLKEQDDVYYKIYALGQWATPAELIYANWNILQTDWPLFFDETIYGLDFGFNNPTALIEVNSRDGVLYEREMLYETGLTNQKLIEKLNALIKDKDKIVVADCAEPARIAEIRQTGFNIIPCDKGKDSIRHSIDAVKRQKIFVHPASVNLIKEKKCYKWAKKGDMVIDEPVKFNDHLMDAERYAVAYMTNKSAAGISVVSAVKDYGNYDDDDMAWDKF